MKNYHHFCNNIANAIFEIINTKGSLLAWKKSWQVNAAHALPFGCAGLYSGVNLVRLLLEQHTQGFASAQWLTFRQVQKAEGRIHRGERGTKVIFYTVRDKEDEEGTVYEQPCCRVYTVFNREQTTLDEDATEVSVQVPSLSIFLKQMNIPVVHQGGRAYYESEQNVIVLPKSQHFKSHADYCVTLLHEIIHWTAGRNRLTRASFIDYGTDIHARAEEELVAEIGSVFLSTYFGMTGDLDNHASYIAHWQTQLTPTDISRAIRAATKAFSWLIAQATGAA